MATKNQRASTPEPEEKTQQTGIDLSKCELDHLQASYAALYGIHSKGEREGSEFAHPHPKNLSTKESFVRAISNWMLVHGDSENAAECDRCHGPMDISLMQDGKIPERCVYCGDGEVEYEDASSPKNAKPKPEAKKAEAKKPAPEPEEEEEAPPASEKVQKRETKIAAKKVRKVKKTIQRKDEPPKEEKPAAKEKKGDLVKVDRAAAKKVVKKDEKGPVKDVKPEVISADAKNLLDDIERVRGSLGKATASVYAEMWNTGKFFQDLQKTKRWQKHPSAFATWKEFVEGCFGVLVNVKRVDELVAFHKANKELPRLDSGVMKLPALPRATPPKPRGEREGSGETETGLKHDPNYLSWTSTVKRKQRIPFLTAKGKPAKKLGESPFFILRSENGCEMKVTIGQTPKGELVANVLFSRE